MFEAKWYNIELKLLQATLLSELLKSKGFRYETSGCFNLVHFEIFITTFKEFNDIEYFLLHMPA